MELEELQKAWKELNERVSQNELVHQQQIIEMLSRQKESCLQRMLRMDKIASIFMLGVTILMFVDFIHLNGKLVFWPAIFGLLLYALTVNFAGVILLTKIKKETNLEMQIKNILRYKMLINWSYIIGYLLVTPFICIFLYTYRHLWWLMITMFGLILAGVLTDYFLFHQCQPVAICLQAELQQPFRFSLLLRDKPHYIFIQPALNDVCMHVGRETVLILLLSEFLYIFIGFFLLHHFYNYKL